MEEPKHDSNTFHLLDMDTPDKKVITIPDQTIVKMNDSIYLFYKGNVIKTHHGFQMFKHENKCAIYSDILDQIEFDEICERDKLVPGLDNDTLPFVINCSTGDLMNREVKRSCARDSGETSPDGI